MSGWWWLSKHRVPVCATCVLVVCVVPTIVQGGGVTRGQQVEDIANKGVQGTPWMDGWMDGWMKGLGARG